MTQLATRQTLFDIGNDLLAIDNLLDETGGELTNPDAEAAITAWFAELAQAESTKLTGYVGYIRQLDMEAEAARQFANHFAAKAQSRENRVKWLKGKMKDYLEYTGRKKAVTSDGQTVAVQKNGGKQPIEHDPIDVNQLPDRFVKVVKQSDNDAIRNALESGETLDFARLMPVGTHLRIR